MVTGETAVSADTLLSLLFFMIEWRLFRPPTLNERTLPDLFAG